MRRSFLLLIIIPVLILMHVGCAEVSAQPEHAALPSEASSRPALVKPSLVAALTIRDLQERPVIGRLGVPLGTAVEIRATIIAGSELRTKADEYRYLLKVIEVDGHALPEPQWFTFSKPGWVTADLAGDTFELYKLKTGKEAHQLDSVQIAKLEEGYVGKQCRVAVYECGEFAGVPRNLPIDESTWQSKGFGFSTMLEILSERK